MRSEPLAGRCYYLPLALTSKGTRSIESARVNITGQRRPGRGRLYTIVRLHCAGQLAVDPTWALISHVVFT